MQAIVKRELLARSRLDVQSLACRYVLIKLSHRGLNYATCTQTRKLFIALNKAVAIVRETFLLSDFRRLKI